MKSGSFIAADADNNAAASSILEKQSSLIDRQMEGSSVVQNTKSLESYIAQNENKNDDSKQEINLSKSESMVGQLTKGKYLNQAHLQRVAQLDQNTSLMNLASNIEVTNVILIDAQLTVAPGNSSEAATRALKSQSQQIASSKVLIAITTSKGYIKLYEISEKQADCVLKKSHFLCSQSISAACQVRLVQSVHNNSPVFLPGDQIACANLANDIFLYSFEKGYVLNQFYAHDDFVIGMLFLDTKLISYSLDQTIKVWDLKYPVVNEKHSYEDYPLTIFDHEAQILSADVLKTEQKHHLLASIDVSGTIYIRNIKGLRDIDIETVMYKFEVPINQLFPSSGDDNLDEEDDEEYQERENSIFKKNSVKLVFSQDRFLFRSPQCPPDMLLLQCEKNKIYSVYINDKQSKELVPEADSSALSEERSLLDGARAIVCDNLSLSLLAWQKHCDLFLKPKE